jgi:uncharacterized membrane protein
VDYSGLRAALAETRRHLLAHHEPHRYHRCYALRIRGRTVRLCARCSGVYPGIAAGLALFLAGVFGSLHLLVVALSPLPALADWLVTHVRETEGYNPVRTATGFLLGTGYGVGVGSLALDGELVVLGVGIGYALLAGAAIALEGDVYAGLGVR